MSRPRSTSNITTAELPLSTMAGNLLERIAARVRVLDDATLRRELEGLVRPLEQAVRRWATVAPRDEQAKACLDLLLEIETRLPRASEHPPPAAPTKRGDSKRVKTRGADRPPSTGSDRNGARSTRRGC